MNRTVERKITLPPKVTSLLKKGVRMTNPFSVEIGEEVKLDQIDSSLAIFGAARIYGENLQISANVQLGAEGPVTLVNCQLGCSVELKGGFFSGSVFLDRVSMGSNAQIRPNCLLEEESGGNHTVGLKQTILFPFVTLGSLINFCDCLLAGGTSRKNHSEVGSSYVHFNFTPKQDKATASLLGEVPRGVMLKEKPIFLGGQGGIVGPVHLEYGTVIPAGTIHRRSCAAEAHPLASTGKPLLTWTQAGRGVGQKVFLNLLYIANLLALRQWYIHVRREFFLTHIYGRGLYAGAIRVLQEAIAERIKQMDVYIDKLKERHSERKRGLSPDSRQIKNFINSWPAIKTYLVSEDGEYFGREQRLAFLKTMENHSISGSSYLEVIKSLLPAEAKKGTDWLGRIVDCVLENCHARTKTLQRREKG